MPFSKSSPTIGRSSRRAYSPRSSWSCSASPSERRWLRHGSWASAGRARSAIGYPTPRPDRTAAGDRLAAGSRSHSSESGAERVHRAAGPLGLRQIDAAAPRRGPGAAERKRTRSRRQADPRARSLARPRVSGSDAFSLAQCLPQCRARPRSPGPAEKPARRGSTRPFASSGSPASPKPIRINSRAAWRNASRSLARSSTIPKC